MEPKIHLEEEKKLPIFKSSGWAVTVRVLGVLALFAAFIFFLIGSSNYPGSRTSRSEREFLLILSVWSVGGGIVCFFKAFLIDKLSELSFYSRLGAEYLLKLTNNQERKDKDD